MTNTHKHYETARVAAYEAEGMTTSDAQGVIDAEEMQGISTIEEVAAASDQYLRALIAERDVNKVLLDALEKAVAWYETMNAPLILGLNWGAQARAAIAKAKGE